MKALLLLSALFCVSVQANELPVAYPIEGDYPALALDRCTRDGCFIEASNRFVAYRSLVKQLPVVASVSAGNCITGICIMDDGHPYGTTVEALESLPQELARR